jgi:hypothetical protein
MTLQVKIILVKQKQSAAFMAHTVAADQLLNLAYVLKSTDQRRKI